MTLTNTIGDKFSILHINIRDRNAVKHTQLPLYVNFQSQSTRLISNVLCQALLEFQEARFSHRLVTTGPPQTRYECLFTFYTKNSSSPRLDKTCDVI